MSEQDGGPAFPAANTIENFGNGIYGLVGPNGMTLRDWFAGQALAQIYTSAHYPVSAARKAYEYADEMLKERERSRETD